MKIFTFQNISLYFILLIFFSLEVLAIDCKTNISCNQRPVAKINFENNQSIYGNWFQFDSVGSYDPEGDSLLSEWFIDGIKVGDSDAIEAELRFGPNKILLKITDSLGLYTVVSKDIVIKPSFELREKRYAIGDILILSSGSYSYKEDIYPCKSNNFSNCEFRKISNNEIALFLGSSEIGPSSISVVIDGISKTVQFETIATESDEQAEIDFQNFDQSLDELYWNLIENGDTEDAATLKASQNVYKAHLATLSSAERLEVLTSLKKYTEFFSIPSGRLKEKNKGFTFEKATLEVLQDNFWNFCTIILLSSSVYSLKTAADLYRQSINVKPSLVVKYLILGSILGYAGFQCSKKMSINWSEIKFLEKLGGFFKKGDVEINFYDGVRVDYVIFGYYKNITVSDKKRFGTLPEFAKKLLLMETIVENFFKEFLPASFKYFQLQNVPETKFYNGIDGAYINSIVSSNSKVEIYPPYFQGNLPSFLINLKDKCEDEKFALTINYNNDNLKLKRSFDSFVRFSGWRPLVEFQSSSDHKNFYFYHNFLQETESAAQDYRNIQYKWFLNDLQMPSSTSNFEYEFTSSQKFVKATLKAARSDGIEGCTVLKLNFEK